MLGIAPTFASTPDWLRQAAQASLPSYPQDTNAVLLLDDTTISVSSSGEVHQTHRKAYKILRPQARNLGTVHVYFDSETQLTFLKGWSITKQNQEYEVKEKEAVETSALSESLYSDTRHKLLVIPASGPGSVIGYEYQQKQRPLISQSIWPFQSEMPVRRARLILELPRDWAFQQHWRNHPALDPQQAGENRWVWDLENIDAVPSEQQMPIWQSVAGCLGLSFTPKGSEKNNGWNQTARWYWGLSSSQGEITSAIREKAQELAAGADNDMEKISRLAFFVQHGIRYVAIEIGIGGYQPHTAQQVFASGYGDCKDKATLLQTMLAAIGIKSYYVLINHDRDYVAPDFPSALSFDHVIVAIGMPENAANDTSFPKLLRAKSGTFLLFDPTDPSTPFGYLPPSLQASYALLVLERDGELIKLPLLPPSVNRLLRTGTLDLDSSGNLKGTIQEVRSGPAGSALADRLRTSPKAQRQRIFEDLLSELIDGAILAEAGVSGLDDFNNTLGITYSFTMPGYAQRAGNLFLFRPCALCRKPTDILEGKPRRSPVAFAHTTSESDVFDIAYPSDLIVDEIPEPVSYQYGIASYKSDSRIDNHVLHYQRTYELKDIRVSVDELDGLKTFFRKIADDQGSYAVMKSVVTK